MKGHGEIRQRPTVAPERWPSQSGPGDKRGLPGYPQRQGPAGGSRHVDPELGFDPDSPDLADPQIDPPHPPRAPHDGPDPQGQRRVPGEKYPPYSRS